MSHRKNVSFPCRIMLTIPGNVIDENYSLLLIENADIDLTTAVLLDKVQKGKPISDDAIKMLRKRKLIEGRKPHLLSVAGPDNICCRS